MTKKGEMNYIIKQCYIGFLRGRFNSRMLIECNCMICKFQNLYQVKR